MAIIEMTDLKQIAREARRDGVDLVRLQLQAEQESARSKFVERIKAAYVLKTYVMFYLEPRPSTKELQWLSLVYPNSKIDQGSDQGASWMSIEPRF